MEKEKRFYTIEYINKYGHSSFLTYKAMTAKEACENFTKENGIKPKNVKWQKHMNSLTI